MKDEELSFKEKIYSIIPIFLFLGLMATSLNSFNWNDDFNYLKNIRKIGFLSELKWQYFNWDGRVSSPLFLMRNIVLYYLPPHFLVFFALLSLFFLGRLLLNCNYYLDFFYRGKYNTLIILIIGILLWSGYRAHLSRSFYWATGSYYSFANLLLFYWIYLFLSHNKSIWFLIITFTVCASGVNVACSIFSFLILSHFLGFRKINLKGEWFWVSILVGSTLLSTLAPGNMNRAHESNLQVFSSLSDFPRNFIIVLKEYIFMSKWMIIGGVVAGFLVSGIYDTSTSLKRNISFTLLLMISALASIMPFVLVPDSASKHTAIHFQTFLFWAIILLTSGLLNQFLFRLNQKMLPLAVNLVSFYAIFVVYQQYTWAKSVKKQIKERYALLEQNRGNKNSVFIPLISIPSGLFINRIWDITDPPNDSNRILENYFDTGPVLPS